MECDHKKPLKDGGAMWDMNNLQAICRGCHIAKTRSENIQLDTDRYRWRQYISDII